MGTILDLKSLKEGMALSDCVVYVQSYKKRSYADGKKFYIAGTFVNQNDSIPFKVWDADMVNALEVNDISGKVAKISGSVTSYQNQLEIKALSFDFNVGDQYPVSLFLKTLDVTAVFQSFVDIVNSELSENGVKLLMGIFKAENLFPRFKEEFAGSKMHDSLIGGLMNHTVKMLRYAKAFTENEPRLMQLKDYKDLLFLGVILHDIGKVYEMHLGVYQENSFVTHRTLGAELLVKYKSVIEQLYGLTFYYQLLAILQGHHGEYGDKPTTVMAYIIHLIDMLESTATGMFDKIESNDVSSRAGGRVLYLRDMALTL